MKRVLFVCTGNSARSQMAEGLLRALGRGAYEAHSAGTEPKGLNPLAVQVMREIGFDISAHRSKSLDGYRGEKFDVVMLSAVWMHLNEVERRDGMPRLAHLLGRSGLLVLTLRHGPIPIGRCMYEVSASETVDLARSCGLEPILRTEAESIQRGNRAAGVTWTHLAFRHVEAVSAVGAA